MQSDSALLLSFNELELFGICPVPAGLHRSLRAFVAGSVTSFIATTTIPASTNHDTNGSENKSRGLNSCRYDFEIDLRHRITSFCKKSRTVMLVIM